MTASPEDHQSPLTPAARLLAAAAVLRERADTATRATIGTVKVRGMWLNQAHYLTTTPARELALATWLESTATPAATNDTCFAAALDVADTILGSSE